MSAPLLLFLALASASGTTPVETEACRGSWSRDGPVIESRWSTWLNVSPADAAVLLRDWKLSDQRIEDVTKLEIRSPSASRAELYIEQKPLTLFSGKRTILLDARLDELKSGAVRLRWRIISGNATKQFRKSWTLRPAGSGTRVDVTMLLELPFDPPDFMLKSRVPEIITEDVERVRRALGASRARAPRLPAPTKSDPALRR